MRKSVRPSRTLIAASACLLAGLFVVQGRLAEGSTPGSGTVTTTAGASWTGGPFLVPNATGTAGTVDCSAPQSCDNYALTVSTPAGTGDTKNLKISVSWPNTAADFDVYVLDPSGQQVASSASSADPETVIMPPTSGSYTVRVVPFLPLGQSYSATASVVDKPTDSAPPGTAPPPGFTNYGAPESMSNAHNAGEPSIGVSDQTNSSFYEANTSTYRVRFDDSVSPATASWSDVSASLSNGCPQGSTTSLDPILYTDRSTGRTFESQLSGVDSLTCYTDDEGTSWHPSQGGGIPSGVDHQSLGGGPFAANDPLNATNLYPRAVYYCSQDIATAFCALSRNGGITFGAGIPIYSLLDCGGLHGHVQVARDGTAYVPNKSCNGHQGVAVSGDDGTTWTVRTIPNSVPSDSDPAVGIGANGTVYVGYANGDGTPHVAVSHDKGQSWVSDFNVGSSLGIKNTVFPTAVAGDDNRAAISFLGTTTGGNYQDAANFTGVWHLYTAFSYDGGATWVTVDDTPTDPVQRGSICTAGTTCGNDRNLLDFIGSTIDNHGRVEVAYADGCTGACVAGTTNNFDAYASIARQSSGLTLYAAYDTAPNLTVSSLTATPGAGGQYTLTARLSNVGGTAATAPVRFLVDGTPLATSSAAALAPGAAINLSTIWHVTGKGKSHTITAIADPADQVAESNENDNRRTITVTLK